MNHVGEQRKPATAQQASKAAAWLGCLTGLLALAACTGSPAVEDGARGYAETVRVLPQRDWSDAVLYFVMLDRFADGDAGNNLNVDRKNPGGFHGGDLAGLTSQLDEIADLGATAIWITPVVQQIAFCPPAQPPTGVSVPGGWFEHCGFHGYWTDDFGKLDPRFGSEDELRKLTDAAHDRGLKVLLDVVYNHVGYDAHYLIAPTSADWIRKKPVECSADELRCQVGGLPDLRTELPEVQDYLLNAHLGLAQRTGLDGFRLDTVKHVEHEFWQRHRRESRSRVSPDFYLLGEVWGGSATVLDPYFENDEMDGGFDFTFKGSCESFVKGKGRTIAFSAYLEKRHRVRDGYQLAHYLSSHDEPMALHNLDGDLAAFRLCVALQMTSLGIPTIYYGEEVARSGSVWPVNRTDMPWGARNVAPGAGLARDESLRTYYKRLIALRRQNPALWRGDYRRLSTEGDLLVFERSDQASDNRVIVAINRGSSEASATVEAPQSWLSARDALNGSEAGVENSLLRVVVPPRQANIYVRE